MYHPFARGLALLDADSEPMCILPVDRHRFFLDMDKESQAKALAVLSLSSSSRDTEAPPKNKLLDVLIFE